MFDVENQKNSNNVMIKKFPRFLRISLSKSMKLRKNPTGSLKRNLKKLNIFDDLFFLAA